MRDETASAPDDPSTTASLGDHDALNTADHPQGGARVEIGDCVGRYTIRARIGSGAMGDVLSAHDPDLDRIIALKMLRGVVGGASPEARIRFQREAQALARLSHPNVVSVFDVGTFEGQVFVAMELVDGPTLATWLAERPRDWRAVVDVFLQAGRGLEVAHAAGIVHRDFKPANVILGERVRVVDFGLARMASDLPDEGSSATSRSLDCRVTQTGQWVGTPAYLAPEVRAGATANAASDQYAFAVALHEALFGVRPGEAATLAARGNIPKGLRTLLERALDKEPLRRYPSMRELLVDLARDQRRTRNRWLAGASAAAVLALAGVAAQHSLAPSAPPCDGGAALVAPVWNEPARARTLEAFRKTGRPTADETFAHVDTALQRRLAGWAGAHRDTCEATKVRHEQSDELFDRRMDCLGQARKEIGAFVELLGKIDARGLDRAAVAAGEAGDIGTCGRTATLGPVVPLPKDPQLRREIDVLQAELARLTGLRILAQYKAGSTLVADILPRARATGYEPVLAETLLLRSWFESNADDKAGALRDLYEVVGLASAARDDVGLARATNLIASVAAAGKGGFAAADVAYPLALGATARAGNQPALLWQLFHNRANVLYDKGEMTTALAFYQLQLLVAPVAYGPDSWQLAVALQDLGDAMTALGAAPQATDLYRRALVLAERVLGPNHDRIATLLGNYGLNLLNVRDADGAAALLERTVAIAELHHPADSRQVAAPLANLALGRLAQRRIPEARSLIDRALQANQGRGDAADSNAALDLIISGEVARAEGHLEGAHELKQRGIALKAKALGPGSASEGNALREDASILLLLGRTKDARETVARAIPILAKALGKDNPDNGIPLSVLGDVLAAEGDWKEALATYQRAVAFLEGYAMDSAWLVEPLVGMSAALVAAGEATRAIPVAERALAIATEHHLSADLAGAAELRLAQARWAAGAGPERRAAIELARSLRTRLAALAYHAEVLPEIDRWLAATNVARR